MADREGEATMTGVVYKERTLGGDRRGVPAKGGLPKSVEQPILISSSTSAR